MLVKNIDEIKRLFPNNTFKTYNKYESFIRSAERRYLIPVLGIPLYEKLHQLYDDEGINIQDKKYRELLELSQTITIQFGIWKAIPSLNVTINEQGNLTVTENSNTVAASKARSDALTESTLQDAWDAVDYLLLFLEKNSIHFTENDKELWKESEWFWRQTGLLIFTATEFEQYIHLENGRRDFIRLLPNLRSAEHLYIRSKMGDKTIDSLITRKMNRKLTDADKKVLPHLQAALANYTAMNDKQLNAPEGTHGYNRHTFEKQAGIFIEMATKAMAGDTTNYPDFPGNNTGIPIERRKGLDQGSCFWLGAGHNDGV
ncbi:MAG: hypothetical protein LUE98_04495 [Tannerellaceae bacterium]|nr:hypothetical protein [Tannerellaceae bacterium]